MVEEFEGVDRWDIDFQWLTWMDLRKKWFWRFKFSSKILFGGFAEEIGYISLAFLWKMVSGGNEIVTGPGCAQVYLSLEQGNSGHPRG